MSSEVAWMNFDAEQQRRTELVMAALVGQGSVDELGLGTFRDLLAHAIHPELTVLQTRVRYLLFLPHIYGNLTSNTTDALILEGRRREGELARSLAGYYRDHDGNDRGIIGLRAGAAAKQPSSVAFWGLLRAMNILQYDAHSVGDYCAAMAEVRQGAGAARALHDEDEAPQATPAFWLETPAPDAAASGFDLTRAEAEWLQQRFLRVGRRYPVDHRPLWCHLLEPDQHTWWPEIPFAWEHPARSSFPSGVLEAVMLGRDLDIVVHGARVLYNYLCAVGRPADADGRDEQVARYELGALRWQDEIAGHWPQRSRLDDLAQWTHDTLAANGAADAARMRVQSGLRFIRGWYDAVSASAELLHDPVKADIVRRREQALKPGRARLDHPDRLRDWPGDSGYFRFDYNWGVATRLLDDIHRGLGTSVAVVDA